MEYQTQHVKCNYLLIRMNFSRNMHCLTIWVLNFSRNMHCLITTKLACKVLKHYAFYLSRSSQCRELNLYT